MISGGIRLMCDNTCLILGVMILEVGMSGYIGCVSSHNGMNDVGMCPHHYFSSM